MWPKPFSGLVGVGQLPGPDPLVGAGGGEELAVGAEGDLQDGVLVAGERGDLQAGLGVVDLGRLVGRARGEPLAVGAVGERASTMSAWFLIVRTALPVRDVPDRDQLVEARRRELVRARPPGEGEDRVGVAPEDPSLSARRRPRPGPRPPARASRRRRPATCRRARRRRPSPARGSPRAAGGSCRWRGRPRRPP